MVLYNIKGGDRKGSDPQRSGEAGVRAGKRQRVLPGWVSLAASLPKERCRTGHSTGGEPEWGNK